MYNCDKITLIIYIIKITFSKRKNYVFIIKIKKGMNLKNTFKF